MIGGIVGAISGAAISMFGSSKKKSIGAKKESPEFVAGRKIGYEEGIREGMNLRFIRTEPVSRKEYQDLIEYLSSRGLVLTYSTDYSDTFSCGLMVRKNKEVFPDQAPGAVIKPLKATIKLKDQQHTEGKDGWICTIRGEKKIVSSDMVNFYGLTYLDIVKAINPEEIEDLKIE